jgi:putative membrane protein
MYHGWNGGGFGFAGQAMGFPWGGLIMAVLFLALIVLLVIAVVRLGKLPANTSAAKERGVSILAERYARGEIDAESFRAMKAELEAKL